MGVITALKTKKLAVTKLFTVLNRSTIETLVEHIEKLSKGKITRTEWNDEIGNKANLNYHMGFDWGYGAQHLPIGPQVKREIKEFRLNPGFLYVGFDEGVSSFLSMQGDSKALGMYLDTTYYRLRRVEGQKALMIAQLSVIEPPTSFEGGKYHLERELWKQA